MRLPSPPPAVDLSRKSAFAAYVKLTVEGEFLRRATQDYWSWDRLRRHPIPDGITAEDAWVALCLHRMASRKPTPLLDRHGINLTYALTDHLLECLLRVQTGAADTYGLRTSDGTSLPFERDVQRSSIIEEAIHSSLIEGAVSTRKDAKHMIEEGRAPQNVSERMIFNNYQTIEMLSELAQEPLSPELICTIHRSMTQGTLDDNADEGRVQGPDEPRVQIMDEEGQIVFQPPDASELPERLKRLCRFANEDEPWMPDAIKAVVLHFQLAHDHPFVDGNGRTARALFYWFMLRKGHHLVRYLSISRIILDSKVRYARAYLDVEQTADLTYFLIYHFDVYQKALEALGEHVRIRRNEVGDAERALARWPQLNLRQKMLLRDALAHPERAYTAKQHAGKHGITQQTAITDLRGLAELELLKLARHGRLNVFRPTDRLPGALAGRSQD